jgi:hypothetical protein
MNPEPIERVSALVDELDCHQTPQHDSSDAAKLIIGFLGQANPEEIESLKLPICSICRRRHGLEIQHPCE